MVLSTIEFVEAEY